MVLCVGAPVSKVLDTEARTRTRLKNGGNPLWYLRLHGDFQKFRDPSGGVSFAEYARVRHPDKIECKPAEGYADGPGTPDFSNCAGTRAQPMPKKKLPTADAETAHGTPKNVLWLWKLVSDSVAAVPANKYAKGVVGIAAVLSLVLVFPRLNARVAAIGIPSMVVLMVALLGFSWANRYGGGEHKPLIRFFLWAMMIVFVVFVFVLFTTFAFGIPAHATKLLYG
jgi:hypothetical protein